MSAAISLRAVHPNCVAIDTILESFGAAGRVRILPDAAPTAVDAGLAGDETGGIPSSLLILLGAAMAVLGLGVGFVPIVARGKHSH